MKEVKEKTIINNEIFYDKVLGCWLGKNAGGTLGEPLEEKFGQDEMFQVNWYTDLPEGGIPNDDLELQLIWLQLLMEMGPGITVSDLAGAWMDCIAYNFDEYGLSKENMNKGLLPPVCGWHNNAFRDCMGSPIRSEIWACIAPGHPEIAARYAFMDAIVDHGGGESVYGEIFNAVIESAAFVMEDKFELLELGLSSIPTASKTYGAVRRVIDNYNSGMDWVENRNDVKDAFFHPVAQYSPLNLGFQTIGWLYGEDFGDAICKAVNCGWDTDCTAATLGAILGIINGAKALPEKWLKPLGDKITTNMSTGGIRYLTAPTNIYDLTNEVCRQARKVLGYWDCDVVFTDDQAIVEHERLEAVDPVWLKEYRPDTVTFELGGLVEEITYHGHAAILGNQPSQVSLTINNLHPISKTVEIKAILPEGFHIIPEGKVVHHIEPYGNTHITYEIFAAAESINEKNIIYVSIDSKKQPAIPALPVVLVGGYRYYITSLFEGKHLDDDCEVREDVTFTEIPEGFHEVWRSGNDLELSQYFIQRGIVYVLHQIYNEREREVVIGVPNNGKIKLFLNGEFLHQTDKVVPLRANLGNGGALGDLSNYKVALFKKGWNQFLIKLENLSDPLQAHFTLGELSKVCYKNHGMPVLEVRRTGF